MNDNGIGCGGLIGTILIIAIILAVIASPLTWIIVAAIVAYIFISRAMYRKQNPDDIGGFEQPDDYEYAGYSTKENVNPYSYRESIPEETPFTENEFDTNAIDVDVEVEVE